MAELYPSPPEKLKSLNWKTILRFLGPGAIIASVTIGSGELVWASRSGAIFGTALMWAFLLAGIFKGLQVYASTRYITLTGEHPMTAWNNTPLLRWWFPIIFIAIPTFFTMPILFSGISEIIGYYMLKLFNVALPDTFIGSWTYREFAGNLAATIILGGCFLLSVLTNLKVLERISIVVLAVLLLCLLIAVFILQPDILDIAQGMAPGRIPDYEPWIFEKYADTIGSHSKWEEMALYLTAVGGGTYDYLGYVGLIREKKWGLAGKDVASLSDLKEAVKDNIQLKRAKTWIKAPLIDTSISFFLVTLVTLLFVIMGASVLHPIHEIPAGNDLLNKQEGFLAVLHPQLTWVYRAGVVLAFIGTLYGAFEIYRHSIMEAVRAFKHKAVTRKSVKFWNKATNTYCLLGALTLVWLPQSLSGNIVDRMVFGAIIGGALTCGLWCFAMLIIDKTRLPKALRMGKLLWLGVLLAGTVLTYLGILSMIDYFAA